MKRPPKAKKPKSSRIIPDNTESISKSRKVLLSFEAVSKNEFFNLDGTCQNWSADLFETMQKVSNIEIEEIYAGRYSGKGLRIHKHDGAKPPCKPPPNISLDDMWQIRISISKGGIHGVFSDNIFYVVWFDPHHNLYPSKNHGGIKKITPPSTCCKDRDAKIELLQQEIEKYKQSSN